ncbi:hypothetical protein EJ03DRAFT_385347 [Teratosphaeria nubilosa]|uniref:HeH/LEM domain-containing protein n=1 Tax=Teratosphaeria nubilosa TaxID=161662 RepID=A0A6G1KXJ6_9PEZI|nr:hypothetical protein EJ03DRAFT_385347 [Teratosphaeria nubilosa]
MDDQAYLEPGFDPKSLTMPRLRSILVAHQITHPASAKKQVLVDIFNNEILPQARKLRDARARVKRSSRGIEDVPSVSRHSTAEDQETPVSGGSSRRTTRAGSSAVRVEMGDVIVLGDQRRDLEKRERVAKEGGWRYEPGKGKSGSSGKAGGSVSPANEESG